MNKKLQFIKSKCKWLRQEIARMVLPSKQGHIASALSQVEICCTLFYGNILNYKKGDPKYKKRDYFIISKGHSAMGAYPIYADLGYFNKKDLKSYQKPKGNLRVYGDKSIPGVECTSGSLSQAVGIAAGLAYSKKINKNKNNVYVIISDGEHYEGSIWETAIFSSHYKLDNLIVIVDRNQQIILGKTEKLMKLEPLNKKWESFGWDVQTVNGHSIKNLLRAFNKSKKKNGKPKLIIAKTIKGKGISFMEDVTRWHNTFPDENEKKRIRLELKI